MRNIIRLIQKYSNFLLFLLFQIISFVFIFNWKNSYHHSFFLNSSNIVIGQIFEWNTNISEYFDLTIINSQLKSENEELKNKIFNQEIILGDHFLTINDTIYKQQYDFISAKVISSNFKFRENYLIINKGNISGVLTNMGVIGTKGIIGIVTNSSSHYATILPVINKKFEMAVRHKNSKCFGLLKWTEQNNWTTAIVEDVPNYISISVGDHFETSASTGIFPEGIFIGEVFKKENINASQFQRIYLKLAEDYSSVYNAYVVKNILQHELLIKKEEQHD